jgi:GGDEF domain-containing protein
LDNFKQFNDNHGHQAGDDCLRAVAACIRDHSWRPGALACRYGGEELAVILGATGSEAAVMAAEAIRSAIVALRIPHQQAPAAATSRSASGLPRQLRARADQYGCQRVCSRPRISRCTKPRQEAETALNTLCLSRHRVVLRGWRLVAAGVTTF